MGSEEGWRGLGAQSQDQEVRIYRREGVTLAYTIPTADEPEDGDGHHRLDPCRVNATAFALFRACNRRCVERRDDDGCFVCNRECNGKIKINDHGKRENVTELCLCSTYLA